MTLHDIGAVALMTTGSLFTLLAAVGVVRMPDFYCRLSTTSKAAPFGIGLVLAGAALAFGQVSFAFQAAVVGIFLVATSPVAAHALARAAYRSHAPTVEGTVIDVAGEERDGSAQPQEVVE